ncbi:F0F1 ATP synthase subunit A [Phaeocystidibacter marisrubri]|uniref:ATP synthase subunit a n=1 Tax=Phaeocystidibacter marisrubri TaxID=1577780 RepID=A0A6L3ZFS2_9FLAO|nr:F0F1 ATP synthase subunit A [Phaeocystidibacter marisrubri]KAB2816526.1 F0F1 ATP synthase subunit A [Phaeocystidibacter marisrubri]GGH69500.1 ATP synthase subunit a [Phaeocystidibacter marisrubri]
MQQKSVLLTLTLALLGFSSAVYANGHESSIHEDTTHQAEAMHEEHADAASHDHTSAHAEEEKFNVNEMIMHHIKDNHSWHILDYEGDNGEMHAVSVPLPIILWTNDGLVTFMSSKFHHDETGHHVAEVNGQRFVNVHDKIYYASEVQNTHGGWYDLDEEGHPINEMPLDFSITKNVFSLLLAAVLLLLIFFSTARFYKKNGASAPKGLASFMEPLIVFVRDDIAKDNIGGKHYERFVPFLLTLFFFIWLNNLLGLVPFFPGGANLTGNIAVTMVLALFTFFVVNFNGKKDYWLHIFWMPGVPVFVRPILAVVEFVGIFTKPFALMLRLFANITAGHILVLSLIGLIFILQSAAVSALSIPLTLFISTLELLVAALQAYIFAMLTALFIGAAVEEHDHH